MTILRPRWAALAGAAAFATLAVASPAAADPPVNSSFEEPVVQAPTQFLADTNPTGIPGWTVTSGCIEVNNFGGAFDGNQTVDLDCDGTHTGSTLEQTWPTQTGVGYRVDFFYGSNPCDGNERTATFEIPEVNATAPLSVTSPSPPTDPGWLPAAVAFEGTGGNITLRFIQGAISTPSCGVLIDAVSITEIPIEDVPVFTRAGIAFSVAGMAAVGGYLWLRRRPDASAEVL